MQFKGRVALVTGGGSGIGRSTARRLAAEGMKVCVVDINEETVTSVAEAIDGIAVVADVSEPAALDDAFSRCLDSFGRLDVAHLNAGVSLAPGDIACLQVDNYRRSIAINVDHVVFRTGAAVRAMRATAREGGPRATVATASLAGIDPFLPNPIYTLTKQTVVGFIRALAPELAAEGISAHVICPGLTDTAQVSPDRKELLIRAAVPFVEPERIADAVVAAISSPLDQTGICWIGNPDQPPLPWSFADVPGPHHLINVANKR